MCGEKKETTQDILGNTGSPSRVRGKGTAPRPCSAARGITPACAGKSFFMALRHRTGRDHPRVCGEKQEGETRKSVEEGSPPRVRGKEKCFLPSPDRTGITPACAGKSSSSFVRSTFGKDHPRVCGEKVTAGSRGVGRSGSPPRVRGKDLTARRRRAREGITPACAGKSRRAKRARAWKKDHPRVCGEKRNAFFLRRIVQGSPPRVRGKARPASSGRPSGRITPACAGKR